MAPCKKKKTLVVVSRQSMETTYVLLNGHIWHQRPRRFWCGCLEIALQPSNTGPSLFQQAVELCPSPDSGCNGFWSLTANATQIFWVLQESSNSFSGLKTCNFSQNFPCPRDEGVVIVCLLSLGWVQPRKAQEGRLQIGWAAAR